MASPESFKEKLISVASFPLKVLLYLAWPKKKVFPLDRLSKGHS
jgi:hypothetical protein